MFGLPAVHFSRVCFGWNPPPPRMPVAKLKGVFLVENSRFLKNMCHTSQILVVKTFLHIHHHRLGSLVPWDSGAAAAAGLDLPWWCGSRLPDFRETREGRSNGAPNFLKRGHEMTYVRGNQTIIFRWCFSFAFLWGKSLNFPVFVRGIKLVNDFFPQNNTAICLGWCHISWPMFS